MWCERQSCHFDASLPEARSISTVRRQLAEEAGGWTSGELLESCLAPHSIYCPLGAAATASADLIWWAHENTVLSGAGGPLVESAGTYPGDAGGHPVSGCACSQTPPPPSPPPPPPADARRRGAHRETSKHVWPANRRTGKPARRVQRPRIRAINGPIEPLSRRLGNSIPSGKFLIGRRGERGQSEPKETLVAR